MRILLTGTIGRPWSYQAEPTDGSAATRLEHLSTTSWATQIFAASTKKLTTSGLQFEGRSNLRRSTGWRLRDETSLGANSHNRWK